MMAGEGTMRSRIEEKLQAAFSPAYLRVTDNSHLHAGHAGAPAGGESHFHVEIDAKPFGGQSRVMRQRSVYTVLDEELRTQVHALEVAFITQ